METKLLLERIAEFKSKGFDPTFPGKRWDNMGMVCEVCYSHRFPANDLIHNSNGAVLHVCDDCFPLFFDPIKVKKVLITSGGTREYIDGVRVLTNISSGKLGALIAEQFSEVNCSSKRIPTPQYEIYFVYVKGSETPHVGYDKNLHLIEVTNVETVYVTLSKLVPDMDVVIHPMAVSDFGFRPIHTKLKSNDPEAFIESLRERIYQTPKILKHIRKWNPNCFLVSFKFEDGLTNKELMDIAFDSMNQNGCDIVVANDKKEMVDSKEHVAYFCRKPDLVTKVVGKNEIAKEIFNSCTSL